jgi:hypothetical protein
MPAFRASAAMMLQRPGPRFGEQVAAARQNHLFPARSPAGVAGLIGQSREIPGIAGIGAEGLG